MSVEDAFRVHPVAEWLLASGRGLAFEGLIEGLIGQLAGAGVDLLRVSTSIHTAHPEVWVRNVTWTRGEGTALTQRPHVITARQSYLESPIARIHAGHGPIRRRLRGPDAQLDFPICREIADIGGTDYLSIPLHYTDGRITFISFATDAAPGFEPEQMALLAALGPYLAARLEIESASYATRSLLEVYLGPNAAARVLAGAFTRGGGVSMDAAIWFCDLRGFTSITDGEADPFRVVALLDRYFERVADAIATHGGEILKFIGDAVLAVFEVREGREGDACARSVRAARAALAGIAGMNEEGAARGDPAVRLGIALHLGRVAYGNIGGRERLDFTVIGKAVNEACRMEALCKPLGVDVVASGALRDACPEEGFTSLGPHALRGVEGEREMYTLEWT